MIDNETDVMKEVESSNWYKYTLNCGHEVYSRVRLRYEKPNRQYHVIRCPQGKHPTNWQDISKIEAVSDEHVSNVLSGTSFVLPNRIMRLENDGAPAGNPKPYTSRDRDY